MQYSTLISDCDGVLIDSEIVAFEVLLAQTQTIFSNIDVKQHLSSAFGQKTEKLVQQLSVKADVPIPAGFLQHLRSVTDAAIEQKATAIADVDVLIQMPQLKAIASNSGMARVWAAAQMVGAIRRGGIQVFSADEVTHPKPAPDLYRLVAQRLNVLPEQCLVIEDSLSGVVAAQIAGMSVIGFTGGAHIPPEHESSLRAAGAVEVFHSMQDLPKVLEKTAGWKQ